MEDYPLKTIIVTLTNRKLKRKKEVKCVEYVREIFAQYDRQCIRVYQAYNPTIAKEAIALQTFGENFNRNRMTWIKPSFLWMMYRCGWGKKENQEHILAIDIKREAFDYLINNAVYSSYNKNEHGSYEDWKEKIKTSDIRIQWDPERDIYGNPEQYRSVQIGLRGNAVKKYVTEWITDINDITDYVTKLYNMRNSRQDITGLLPDERIYHIKIQV